jgi:hypothetical protein
VVTDKLRGTKGCEHGHDYPSNHVLVDPSVVILMITLQYCEPKENDATRVSNTQKSGSTPPAESENKPASLANTVAEHDFEGDGIWMAVEEEVAPALTIGADPDPILGDPDETWFGPQDLEPSPGMGWTTG